MNFGRECSLDVRFVQIGDSEIGIYLDLTTKQHLITRKCREDSFSGFGRHVLAKRVK
jgi:hypothetical protein